MEKQVRKLREVTRHEMGNIVRSYLTCEDGCNQRKKRNSLGRCSEVEIVDETNGFGMDFVKTTEKKLVLFIHTS